MFGDELPRGRAHEVFSCHPREDGDPQSPIGRTWIPASAGMTVETSEQAREEQFLFNSFFVKILSLIDFTIFKISFSI